MPTTKYRLIKGTEDNLLHLEQPLATLIPRHFFFESVTLKPEVAHGGSATIHAHRALQRTDGINCNFIDFVSIPPDADIGRHTHSLDNEEIYVVISGHGLMRLDDHEFAVGPGHVIINRPGGTHSLNNAGDTDLRLVVIEVPVSDQTVCSTSS
jgi:mannose-6-phosphate isomerase-like protein (cupin superfamily)